MDDGQEHRDEHRPEKPAYPNLLPPWQPGQSGNPGGRPKGKSLTAICREILESRTLRGVPIPDDRTVADVLAEVIVEAALSGKFAYTKELWDRVEGKVKQSIELGGGENPIPVEVLRAIDKAYGDESGDAPDPPEGES